MKKVSLRFNNFKVKEFLSESQMFGLFAILAGLTLIFVIFLKVIRMSPGSDPVDANKSAIEAKISP
ncbi:MAG: hypothetical protein ACK41T_06105 [Pseudobdellovibrio sp.]